MNKRSAVLLQVVIVLVGAGVLALMLWEPHLEGRNAHSTLYQVYFNDPFLAYAYLASTAFFVALYQAFKLVGYAGSHDALSPASMKALRTIRYCALTLVAALAGAEAYFVLVQRGKEDIAGGVMMGLLLILIASAIAATATVLEKSVARRFAAQA